jgi:hypothetical protein
MSTSLVVPAMDFVLIKASMFSGIKPSFPFNSHQQGVMRLNFNRSEPSLKDIVQDQQRINSEVGKKLLANDRILESIDSKMNNFTVAVQNQ